MASLGLEESTAIWTALAVVAAIGLAVVVLRRRPRVEDVIRFDMVLPSKWAAELTQRVLEGEGVRSRLGPSGAEWICRVTLHETFDAAAHERSRAHFHQIAEGRGGDCPSLSVIRGDQVATYEGPTRRRR